jgi:hypothetical protein
MEDYKVSLDELQEKIAEFEGYVRRAHGHRRCAECSFLDPFRSAILM